MCFLDTFTIKSSLDYIPTPVKENSTKPFEFNNLEWLPVYKSGRLVKYVSAIDNLNLSLNGDSITINNSWGVFWNGNNSEDYTSSQIEQTYLYLDYITEGIVSVSKPSKVAIGANIELDLDFAVNPFIRLFNQVPVPMLKRSNIYGYQFIGSYEKLKIYSKTKEQLLRYRRKIPPNLVRIELEMNVNYINRNSDVSLLRTSDILDKKVKLKLAKRLIEKLQKIETSTILPVGLTLNEKKIMACFRDQEIIQAIRNEHPESYKKDRRRYNKIISTSTSELKETIIKKTTSKVYDLINS